ncbi:MAG: SH3 domain-containing protein [Scytolyngbya sp. HA4215-MV1]|nr:SH3 domain-containing protein [Scytolyngbya sp. HA4215-MV1]
MKAFSFLIAIALFFPAVVVVPDAARSAPKLKGCLDSTNLRQAMSGRGNYMLFDRNDRSANHDGPINIREKPSVRARVRYVAASRNPVDILKQVAGEDGYCWLNVRVVTGQSTTQAVITVTGWVRGDLITTASD